MIFRQFYLEALGHASYLVGSEQTGEALVLDVRRDVDTYFSAAHDEGLRIAYACDTHQHNDYVTGITELPERGEVQLLAGARAELGYPVRAMDHGERLEIGELAVEVLHTPGHTPEHVSLLVTDRERSEEPALLLSGGALLVGDVARPDLLGDADDVRENARAMCRTLQEQILALPDHVEVYPTHVAGSLCGGNIGRRLSTTIGYEKRANRFLKALAEREQFVRDCMELKDLPAVPPYWKRMRRMNTEGPPPLGVLADPPPLEVAAFERRMEDGALVLDCRSPEAFTAHVPGALNVGFGTSFPTWAGTVLPADARTVLVLERPDDLWEVCWHLLRIGYPLPEGWLSGGMLAWRASGRPLEIVRQWDVAQLKDALGGDAPPWVLDVRQPAEWASGHIPGARHITGAELPERLDEVPGDRAVAVVCGSGYRSSVMTSLLRRAGREPVFNVLGGMGAWQAADYPLDAPRE
ncbi:MAG: MBL fold metallo-hydrolase [Gammaproteobacteria bacterium]|nr:MBL fold metallo-hydrolase [Gammaproteobacteria bacterium]